MDAIYYCPHHPHTGSARANREFEIECDCRKPRIAMIRQAQKDLGIDLAASFLIGDTVADVRCGRSAGLVTIGVQTGHSWNPDDGQPDYMCRDLGEAVGWILAGKGRGRRSGCKEER